ncbi:MAG: cardiolipin synthase [Halioglobus sp.]|jgi:cardiolipin synthase
MEAKLYTEIFAVLVVLLYIMAVISALEAILKGRTAQGSIAWTISLLTLPWLTVPLYLVFGRNKFDGYLEKRDVIEAESQQLIDRTSGSVQQHIVAFTDDQQLNTSLLNLARMPATAGNKVELLIDGNQTFDSIAAGLEKAEKYILFQFYIIRDDDLGNRLCRILQDKARAGVKVYFLYDEIGSRPFPRTRLCNQLTTVGVHVAPFNTTQGRRNRLQLNFRNHRKIVVVDGKCAWIGGHNVGNEYLGLDKRVGHWRDTHARFEGPAVAGAELAFATDWLWATRANLELNWNLAETKKGDSKILVFPSAPASEYEEAGLMFHQIIVAARRRIWIASPYFVPDRAIVSALQLAALRGVDVRLIIPDEPDGPVIGMANWSYTDELLPLGVKFYRYQGGFMHQKVLLMDDHLAGVGTANFDNRSFRLNFEITLLVEDSKFASQVEDMLQRDMERSRQVTQEEIKNKPPWFPLAMGAARLLAPVL